MTLFQCCSQAKILTKGAYAVALKGLPSRYGLIRDIGGTTRPFSTSTGIDVEKLLQEMLANFGYNSESGIDNDVKRSVERILNPQQDRCMHVEAPEKVRNQIAIFQKRFGNKHFVSIFELSLQLALIQNKSNILGPSLHGAIKAYSLGYSPDISRLVADWNNSDQKIESNGTKYCVYAYTWIDLLVGEMKSIFDSQKVSDRSKKATSLLKKVSKLYKHEQSPTTIALSYFGMTTSPTVKERETRWTYKSNVLMHALWTDNDDMKPQTVVVFQIPEKYHKYEYTNRIISVVEFLLIELFNTYGGMGFNQEPGGRFNSGRANFVTYTECVELVQSLDISSRLEFEEWCQKNSEERIELGIPSTPAREYEDKGWVSYYEFFGTQSPVTEDAKLPYDECAEFIRSLGITSHPQFRKWRQNNSERRIELGIPSNPDRDYKDQGWVSWYVFLGTQPPVTEDTKLSYDECAEYIRGLGIKSAEEFRKWRSDNPEMRRQKGIPFNPDRDYKDQGWVSWYHFLETQPPVTEDTKLPYDECAEFIRGLCLNSAEEFNKWCKDNPMTRLETSIPSNPTQAYKDIGWINWNHFLGTQPAVTEDTKLPYDECAKYIQGLHIKSVKEFRKWCNKNPITRRHKGIPFNPDRDYKDQGWKDWPAFLLGDKLLDIIH